MLNVKEKIRHRRLFNRRSGLEALMLVQIEKAGCLSGCQLEYMFCPGRRWRFDFAWPLQRIALEVEGGSWINGRHTRGSGFEKDCEKYNEAAARGWHVLRVTGKMIADGRAVHYLKRTMEDGYERRTQATGRLHLRP